MKIINRFIDWKKNIKFIPMYELNVIFQKNSNLNQFKLKFENIEEQIGDQFLKQAIKNFGLQKEEYRISEDFYGEKYRAEAEPLINSSIYHRQLEFAWIYRKKKRLDNINVSYITEDYPNSFIEYLMNIDSKNLYVLLMSNPTLNNWDMKKDLIFYEYQGGINLKKHPIEKDKKIVDISKRPGRAASLENFYFKGGHEYWFGEQAYNVLSKKNILAFSQAQEVNELENNIVHVKLFEMHQYWEEFAQARLAAFRKHLNIDELQKEYLKSINLTK